MPHISERQSQLPELEFPKIFKQVITNKKLISLAPGEPDFTTPEPLLTHARKLLKAKKGTHYSQPQGNRELRNAIAKKLNKENKIKQAHPDNVLVTCGSQEALFAALLTTIDPTEEVITTSPGYLGYIPAIHLVNGIPKYLKVEESDQFQINPDKLRKLVNKKKTKVIILNSPNNPCGTVMPKKIMEEIADIAIDTDTHIFSDEAYEHITYDNAKHHSIGSLNGMEDYVTTFQTFSKSHAMCGFRIGYCQGPTNLIQAMNISHHYTTLTAPNISQLIAIKALQLNKKYIDTMVKEYDRRRKLIVSRLNELGLPTQTPKGAFYTFSNITKYAKTSLQFVKDLIKHAEVATVPGTEFGPHGEGYIRCSYATKYEKIEAAMNRIEHYLKKRK